MATSKHLAIRAAIAALFVAGTPLAEGRVFENRRYALAEGQSRQVHVNFGESLPVEEVLFTGSPRKWASVYELVILARAEGAADAADVADDVWVDAYGRLMADQTLGGLLTELEPGQVDVQNDTADTSLCRLDWRITCWHQTDNDSISS